MVQETARASAEGQLPMKWIWLGVFLAVALIGGFVTPWEALEGLLQNQGVGDEQAQLLAFVAGFTLPLTAGLALVFFGFMQGWHQNHSPWAVAGVVALVLWGSGALARELGLGLLPSVYVTPVSGPPGVAQLMMVLQSYLNTYGWALALCSAAIAFGVAAQGHTWLEKSRRGATN